MQSRQSSSWSTKEQMITMIYRQTGERVVRIDIVKESKPFSTGKDRYSASFFSKDSNEPLFVCMASRREVSKDPQKFKMSYCPHDSRNLLVEEKLIETPMKDVIENLE